MIEGHQSQFERILGDVRSLKDEIYIILTEEEREYCAGRIGAGTQRNDIRRKNIDAIHEILEAVDTAYRTIEREALE